MTFTLQTPPGFSDLPDSVLDAEKSALGLKLARISGNTEFGAVRPEIFFGKYKDGETVQIPTSEVDGYTYQRDELIYLWGIFSTVNASSGWVTGPGPLWYCAWKVDQGTGAVSCIEWYRNSEGDIQQNSGTSTDGVLMVTTIAIRQRKALTIQEIPNFVDVPDVDFDAGADNPPLRTSPIKQLNQNAKYSCVAGEVFYLGEYTNGQTVTLPVSAEDGYPYEIGECRLVLSWRWTTAGAAFTQPDFHLGQLHRITASVDPTTGVVSTEIRYYNSGVFTTTHGRVAVFAFCSRTNASSLKVKILPTTRPWMVSPTLNAAYPYSKGDGTAPIRIKVNSGDVVNLTYLSGTVRCSDARPYTDAAGQLSFVTGTTLGDTGKRFPTYYIPASALGLGGAVGLWADDTGALLAAPFDVGLGGAFTAPADGWLQLGVNDVQFNDNVGTGYIFAATVGGPPPAITFSTPTFFEIAAAAFFAGNPAPEELLGKMNNNNRLALVRQEYFGPALYTNGQTVPLPVSTFDGYHFTRAELFYVSEIATTGPESGGDVDIRFWEFDHYVDSAGVVHMHEARRPQGGGNLSLNQGSVRVLVIGVRDTDQGAIYDPTSDFVPRPPGDNPGDSQSFLVDGTVPGELGPTNIGNVNAHNTSANAAYNKANFPSGFTGTSDLNVSGGTFAVDSTKEDDSENPATPKHVSNEPVSLMFPTHPALKIGPHDTDWWGGPGHPPVGINCNTAAWVKAKIDDQVRRGCKFTAFYWAGPGTYTDDVAKLSQAYIATLPAGTIEYCIDIDHSALKHGSLASLVTYVSGQFFGDAAYFKISGKPVLQFFDVQADLGDVAMAAAKAATTGSTAFWMPNGTGSLGQAWCDGPYLWIHVYTDGLHVSDRYKQTELANDIAACIASGKKYMAVAYKGFNGTRTLSYGWSRGKLVPHDWGKCWLTTCATIEANIDGNCVGVVLATWNDKQEGSSLEEGIANDLVVSASVAGTTLNFGVTGGTGDETTVAHYVLWVSTDGGKNMTAVATQNTGVGTFNLAAVGLTAGTAYTLWVQAIGKPFVHCQLSAGVAYTA